MLFKGKGKKLCFGLLLVLFIIFGFLFVGSSDVNAYTHWVNNPSVNYTALTYTSSMSSVTDTSSIPFTILNRPNSGTSYLVGFTVNGIDVHQYNYSDFTTFYLDFQFRMIYSGNGLYNYFSNVPAPNAKISVFDSGTYTNGTCELSTSEAQVWYQYHCSVSLPEHATPDALYLNVGEPLSTGPPFTPIASISSSDPAYNPHLVVNYIGYGYDTNESQTNAYLDALGKQNDVIIEQNQTIIENDSAYYNAEYDAVDNIENQDAGDIDVGTGSYTNLLGLLQGFVAMLQFPRILNCELTLPFPDFAGGSVTVNPCSFKEKAPAIVQWGSSLLLVTFFIPFAFIMLKLIYNEIRSWTNG